METRVAELASKLLSDEFVTVMDGYAALAQPQSRGAPGSPVFPRLIQELAIYQQGSVLKNLLELVLEERNQIQFERLETPGMFISGFQSVRDGHAHIAYLALNILAASKSVAQFILRKEGAGAELLRNFMEHLPRSEIRQELQVASTRAPTPFLIPSLNGLLNYARASEHFRRLIRDADNLLPSLQLLLTAEVLQNISPEVCATIRRRVASLLFALILSKDSREWAIQQGYLGLLASIYSTATHREDDEEAKAMCSFVLLCLIDCDCPELVTQLKEAGFPSLLEPYASSVERFAPGLWNVFSTMFSDTPQEPFELPSGLWKHVKAKTFEIPTVCSWEGCVESASIFQETKFKRCARCTVAYYCRCA